MKICFLGTAIPTCEEAPFDDPEWEIWCVAPACFNMKNLPRDSFDRWFEFHDAVAEDKVCAGAGFPGYIEWMCARDKPTYYLGPPVDGIGNAPFPRDEILKRHGGFFLDSTTAWMMAFAYDCMEPDEIGLWGTDFATEHERLDLKKGTKHFMELFKLKGISCFVPDLSEMKFDPEPYPVVSKLGSKLENHLRLIQTDKENTEKQIRDLTTALPKHRLRVEQVRGIMETFIHAKDNWS